MFTKFSPEVLLHNDLSRCCIVLHTNTNRRLIRFSVVCTASQFHEIVRDTISEILSDFLPKSKTPVQVLWSLRSIDFRVISLHLSFVKLCMSQNASLAPLISEPIRVVVIVILFQFNFTIASVETSLNRMISEMNY